MTILKQMEEGKITLGEVQELILLLNDAIPKIQKRVKQDSGYSNLASNLREELNKISGEGRSKLRHMVTAESKHDLKNGLDRLQSVHGKLKEFEKVLKDIEEG